MLKTGVKYFGGSVTWSVVGIILAGFLGYFEGAGSAQAVFQAVSIVVALSLLELSISFENAVVNATVLRHMTPAWQRRFLTWGILIAVFGMRLVFPLLIVCVSTGFGPIEALKLALFEPQKYSEVMLGVHAQVAAFGGAFLAMAFLKYFFDREKEVHWIHVIEAPLARMGRLESIEIAVVLGVLWFLTRGLDPAVAFSVLLAGVGGIVVYILVASLGTLLSQPSGEGQEFNAARASFGMFLYLEVLDASFSFDGVIGAFAISDHLLYITIGLGIGALFVRSLTVLMVEKGTLDAFKFLEHGAFWAVGSLATFMFLGVIIHIPEGITASLGIVIIAISIWSSLRHRPKIAT